MTSKENFNSIDDSSILSDIGENYAYIKTIIHNNVEIKKLELIKSSSGIVGKLFLAVIMLFISLLLFIVTLSLAAVALAAWLESWIYALGIVTGVLFFIILFIYVFRKPLVINRVENIIHNLVSD